MAYSPQTWADGPTGGTPISAARLQHIEDGIVQVETDASGTYLSAPGVAGTQGVKLAPRGLSRLNPNLVGMTLYEPNIDTVMATPPTLSESQASVIGGSSRSEYAAVDTNLLNPLFGYYGLPPVEDGGNFWMKPGAITYTLAQPHYSVAVRHTGSRLEIMYQGATGGQFQVRVDGQLVQASSFAVNGTGGIWYRLLDFSGVRKTRLIEIESGAGFKFGGVRTDTIDTLNRVDDYQPRLFLQGDSFPEADSGITDRLKRQQIVLPRLLGMRDVWNVSTGGTGLLNNGGGSNGKTTVAARMAADVYAHLASTSRGNVIVFSNAGFNDTANNGYTSAALTAAMAAWLTDVKANAPDATVIVIGLAPMGTPDAAQIDGVDAIKAALDAHTDCWDVWIDPVNAVWATPDGRTGGRGSSYTRWAPSTAYTTGQFLSHGGVLYKVTGNFTSPSTFTTANLSVELTLAWFWGTGKVGTTTGDGNADEMRYSDGTHPTDLGDGVIAREAVRYLRNALDPTAA